MSDVTVYFHNGPHGANIGPLGAWAVGDRVTVPPRGPKLGDSGMPGFEGVVTHLDEDGMARVSNVLNEDVAA